MMTRGVEPNPKDLDGNGNFVGKLKSDQYLHNGRVYQEVPDFLKPYIWRLDGGQPDEQTEVPSVPILEKSEAKPAAKSSESQTAEPNSDDSSDDAINELTSPLLSNSMDVPFEPEAPTVTSTAEPTPDPTATERPVNGEVFQWTFRAMPTKQAMRKVHALCILTEGNVALRIVNREGVVILSEKRNVTVDPQRFSTLAELFGVG
jgi:hypothetical protein